MTCGRTAAPGVGETAHVVADLALPGEPERVVGEASDALGGLDVLVNNVGVARQARFEDVTDEEWDHYWAAERDVVRPGDPRRIAIPS